MSLTETYKGRKLAVKAEPKQGRASSWINGELLGYTYGATDAVITREMTCLRGWIDAADERRKSDPDAYPPHFYVGTEAAS